MFNAAFFNRYESSIVAAAFDSFDSSLRRQSERDGVLFVTAYEQLRREWKGEATAFYKAKAVQLVAEFVRYGSTDGDKVGNSAYELLFAEVARRLLASKRARVLPSTPVAIGWDSRVAARAVDDVNRMFHKRAERAAKERRAAFLEKMGPSYAA